jgi:hypothetical protein
MKTTEKESMVMRMRQIRDQLNEKIVDMSFQEEKTYIKQELLALKKKRKMAGNIMQPRGAPPPAGETSA